jgi:hypothetical protein
MKRLLALPHDLDPSKSGRQFPLSPSEGERAGVRSPFLPWASGSQRPLTVWVILFLFLASGCTTQTKDTAARLQALEERFGHLDTRLTRQMNEILWF